MLQLVPRLLRGFSAALAATLSLCAGAAQHAAPVWYGASASASSAWHYRIAVTAPAGTVAGHTVVADVDFAALLAQMGVSGTFDVNSPRVVDASGALTPTQEFSDAVYQGTTDALSNARGELRFLATGPSLTYYVYFDVTANGTKPVNSQTKVGGNFEGTAPGTQSPSGWVATKAAAAFDAQVRPAENPSVGTDGQVVGNGSQPRTVDGTPLTGQFSYLMGSRTNNESVTQAQAVVLSRQISVPASNPGVLTFSYRVQGWDSGVNGDASNFDYLDARIIDGATNVYLVGPSANNYTTYPFAPSLGPNQATSTASGYGQYNGFDTDTRGRHRSGMTVDPGAQPWWTVSVDLAPYAGKTITLRFSTRQTVLYRSWWHIDDVEWSKRTATLGTPEGFGASLAAVSPTGPGQTLSLSMRLDAVGKAGAVAVQLYTPSGALATTALLYDDGTHGDVTLGDGLWTNSSAYVFPSLVEMGSWPMVGLAYDKSTAADGQPNGLIRVPGRPLTPMDPVNFYNVATGVVPVTQAAVVNGWLYDDTNTDGNRTPGEPGFAGASGLYVKLLNSAGSSVLATVPVSANGTYALPAVAPGTYRVQVDNNSSAADLVAFVPTGYTQSEPGLNQPSHTVVLAAGNIVERNFGYVAALVAERVQGTVFFDNGAGGATALDGQQALAEPPVIGQAVELVSGTGTVLAQASTSATGAFALPIPSGYAGELIVRLAETPQYAIAGVQPGTTGGQGSSSARTLTFTYSTGSPSGVVFQALRPVRMVADQARTVAPGVPVQYGHQLTATAEGVISFVLSTSSSGAANWSGLLYRDLNCSGTIDGADSLLTGSLAVAADTTVCVVVLDNVPAAAAVGASAQHTLVATYQKNSWVQQVLNTDITSVSNAAAGSLSLLKEVRNLTTGSAWALSGPAQPGQQIQYRLTYTNGTAAPVTAVTVRDTIPSFTVFVSASCGGTPQGVTCAVTQSPGAGATSGSLQWSLTGAVPPGASGAVDFTLAVQN